MANPNIVDQRWGWFNEEANHLLTKHNFWGEAPQVRLYITETMAKRSKLFNYIPRNAKLSVVYLVKENWDFFKDRDFSLDRTGFFSLNTDTGEYCTFKQGKTKPYPKLYRTEADAKRSCPNPKIVPGFICYKRNEP